MKTLKTARHVVFFGVSACIFAATLFFYNNGRPVYGAKTAEANEQEIVFNTAAPRFSGTFPIISAQGAYVYELSSGEVLYDKNSDALLFPASTTKIVTALVSLDYYKLDDVINTGHFSVGGSKMGLNWTENISVRDLMYGLLIHSANDAAEVLAANYPEGRAAFIQEMNRKVWELGAESTRFGNPSGLDQEGQITTAKDLARISSYAMENPVFAEIVATERYTAREVGGTAVHYLKNKNELLGKVPGVLGVKTGWTESARENLVTQVERDGRRVMIVLLGSQNRFGETEELIEWIFTD